MGTGEIVIGGARDPDHRLKNRGFRITGLLPMFGHSASHPDQDSDPDRNRERDQRGVLDLARDSLESIIADLGAEFGCIMAETYGLVSETKH
jgi:hypothetical protein